MFRVIAFHADKSIVNPSHQPCADDALLVRLQCIRSALRGFRGWF